MTNLIYRYVRSTGQIVEFYETPIRTKMALHRDGQFKRDVVVGTKFVAPAGQQLDPIGTAREFEFNDREDDGDLSEAGERGIGIVELFATKFPVR